MGGKALRSQKCLTKTVLGKVIKVLENSTEFTKKVLKAKKNYILKMTTKLEHSHTGPKTY